MTAEGQKATSSSYLRTPHNRFRHSHPEGENIPTEAHRIEPSHKLVEAAAVEAHVEQRVAKLFPRDSPVGGKEWTRKGWMVGVDDVGIQLSISILHKQKK